jgi:hypothetical protein
MLSMGNWHSIYCRSSFVIFNFAIDSDHFINTSILLTEADVLIPFVILILFLATFIFHIALILFMPLVRLPIMVFGESGPKFSVFKEAFVVPSILVGVPGIFVGVLAVKIAICIAATLVHILPGIYALPRNFRRLTIFTSPTQNT